MDYYAYLKSEEKDDEGLYKNTFLLLVFKVPHKQSMGSKKQGEQKAV